MKDTPYRLFAVISAMLYLIMLLLCMGLLFPGTGIVAWVNSLPSFITLPLPIVLFIITSILSMKGAERLSRKAGIWKYWEASLSGAPPWMVRALKVSFAYMGLAVIVHVIQLAQGNTGSETYTTPLFMSLVGMAFSDVNTVLLFSIAVITDRNPPSPERLRFTPRDNVRSLDIRHTVLYRKAGARMILPLLAPALFITAIRFSHAFFHRVPGLSGPEFYARSGAALAIMAALFALVYGAMYLIGCYRLVYDSDGLTQVRFGITRRVRWDELKLIEYQEKRFHDRSGWSPEILFIHGRSVPAIVITGDLEKFSGLRKIMERELQNIYGVSYKDMQEQGWWGERYNWFLSAGIQVLRFVVVAGTYLALIMGILFCAENILRLLGLSA